MAGIVLAYLSRLGTPMLAHEKVTLEAVARSVAQVKHYEFGGWQTLQIDIRTISTLSRTTR